MLIQYYGAEILQKKKQKRSTVILILPDLTITESTLNAKGNIENIDPGPHREVEKSLIRLLKDSQETKLNLVIV